MAKYLALSGIIAAAAFAPSAYACTVIRDHEPSYSERKATAKKIIADATAILDSEVVEAGDQRLEGPARIRVVRVFKGDVPAFVEVQARDSCDIDFTTPGQRWRFVLQGGPEIYSTWVDYSNAVEIDRLLESDRRKDWPLKPR